MELSERLKKETRSAHQALDQHPMLRSLVARSSTIDQYRLGLQAMYRAWKPLESAVENSLKDISRFQPTPEQTSFLAFCDANFKPRRHALVDDLRVLGVTSLPSDRAGFGFVDVPQLLGGLYVFFGAQLGSRVIAASVTENVPGAPTGFFTATHQNVTDFWKQFRIQLDDLPLDQTEIPSLFQSATMAFEEFRKALD
ncbi:biliverdin-producing heme oxygenase [Marinobacter sp. CHS3-4]|uniref:biliverdin-producing heme oxygenase n=1 Tax=Marinobacter sp. CHS3-4 TaxID=3045174 RepID=UPI0024B49C9D|nr:biliverdin-producing heme oxygenase [Marinobacter sp. CHS3-4]MDI9245630.1 biliverdin-producing heme oxygenase [Marinobacter sp. CHS3-4]